MRVYPCMYGGRNLSVLRVFCDCKILLLTFGASCSKHIPAKVKVYKCNSDGIWHRMKPFLKLWKVG